VRKGEFGYLKQRSEIKTLAGTRFPPRMNQWLSLAIVDSFAVVAPRPAAGSLPPIFVLDIVSFSALGVIVVHLAVGFLF